MLKSEESASWSLNVYGRHRWNKFATYTKTSPDKTPSFINLRAPFLMGLFVEICCLYLLPLTHSVNGEACLLVANNCLWSCMIVLQLERRSFVPGNS